MAIAESPLIELSKDGAALMTHCFNVKRNTQQCTTFPYIRPTVRNCTDDQKIISLDIDYGLQ